MTKEEAKETIEDIVRRTVQRIPSTYEKDLPPMKHFPDVPQWHNYEYAIWKNGEQIRQILLEYKNLRKDKSLFDLFLLVALNRNAKRGRQSFILLFGYKSCAEYADLFVRQLDDIFVRGHILEVLNKMKVPHYVSLVMPYITDEETWIRNQAKKYVKRNITSE